MATRAKYYLPGSKQDPTVSIGQSKRYPSDGGTYQTVEEDDTLRDTKRPKLESGVKSVESAGVGSKPSGSPGGKGSSREYPVPKRKPPSEYKSESSDGRDYAKMRDKAVVDASDRFNSSDHG